MYRCSRTATAALLLALLALTLPISAQSTPFPAVEATAPNTAVVEGYQSPKINPAALAFGNARGITYVRPFDNSGIGEDWELSFNGRYLAYGLEQFGGSLLHSLTFASSPITNLYTGLTMTTATWDLASARYTTGLLLRPVDYLSLGGRGVFRSGADPQSAIGAAVRPFALAGLPDRLLTAGFEIGFDRLSPSSYTISLGSSPVDWLEVGASYDLNDGSFSASLALSLYHLKSGAAGAFDSNAAFNAGRGFVTASPRPYTRPFKGRDELLLHRYELDGQIIDASPATTMGGFYFISDDKTIWQVREELKRLQQDPRVDGIAFVNSHPQISLSTAVELIAALREFKAAGKQVVFYQEYMSSMDYLLAAATGDEVYLHPGGMIDFRGMAISRPYLERFLAGFGVEVENFRSHPYKSSYNFITEPGMTEAEREVLSMLLGSLQEDMLRLVREGRGDRLSAPVEELVAEGPYLVAERALDAGLIDGTVAQDRFTDELQLAGGARIRLREQMPPEPFRRDWSDPYRSQVAVINAVGTIYTGEGSPGSSIGAKTLSAALRSARTDPRVAGILLRIDSGGGSALASEMIAREVELAVTGENPVPVVVSMGATAASGGYYIGVYADRLVAYPTTLTGSIGVVGVFPHIEGLLEQQKIAWDVVKEHEQADMGALYRELSDGERSKLQGAIMHKYERFISAVSEGRGMERDEVDEVARGRVWSGRQAAQRGLVDELGGIDTALAALQEEIGTDQPLELRDYTYRGVFPTLRLGSFSSGLLAALHPSPWPAELTELSPAVRSAYLRLLNGEQGLHDYVLTMMPYRFPEITGEGPLP